jgi:hypothetical protein
MYTYSASDFALMHTATTLLSTKAGHVLVQCLTQIDDYEGRLWHPLITKAGRWLRRYGLDELRLLINTISGQLSLVKSALRVFSFERATLATGHFIGFSLGFRCVKETSALWRARL